MSLGWKGGDSSRSGRATGVNDVVLFKGLGGLGKEMTRLTRTDHHGTDPRNSSSLYSCPSRAHRRLSAYRQHLHTDPTPLPAFQPLQQLWKVRNPAREDIPPSLTRQLCLADLPHPELNPAAQPTEASSSRRHQRSHAAGVCMGSHTLEICSSFPFHCPDGAKMLHLQAGETSWLRGHGRFSQQQRFLTGLSGVKAVSLLSAIYMLYPE